MADFLVTENSLGYTKKAFVEELINLRKGDDKIVLLTTDVARSTYAIKFEEIFPESFFNLGIQEQNAVGVASGMTRAGLSPYITMFSSFASKRALDFIFSNICYPDKKVVIVATHSGTSFGEAGPTHHSLEDVTIMRSLPNIAVVVPCDYNETLNAIKASYTYSHPMYIRINRGQDYNVYSNRDYGFEIGKGVTLTQGEDVAIIANGSCVKEGLMAYEELKKEGIVAEVINMHTVCPIDKQCIIKASRFKKIVTCEDGRNTGLGGSVAEVLSDNGIGAKTVRLGVKGISPVGRHRELLKHNQVDKDAIIKAVKSILW